MQTFIFICPLIALVLSDVPPAPPQDIHVDNWILKWTPASTERNVNYIVQYSKFDENKWLNVTPCAHTSLNSCDVSFTKLEAEYGCVKIRVLTERNGLTSKPVEACSRQGDSCTPDLSLAARPGSLTVHLSRDHILAEKNADHAGYRVCYGKEQPLQHCEDSTSSLNIHDLDEGQRYCVQVQYTNFNKRVGLPTCMKCEDIPHTRVTSKQMGIIVGVVAFVAVVVLLVLVYLVLFHREKIKRFLQPPAQLPSKLLHPVHHIPLSPISDEEYDHISEIVSAEPRGD